MTATTEQQIDTTEKKIDRYMANLSSNRNRARARFNNRWMIGKKAGSGSYGTAYNVKDTNNDNQRAILKVSLQHDANADEKEVLKMIHEKVPGAGVVSLLDEGRLGLTDGPTTVGDPNTMNFIVTEKMKLPVFDYINKSRTDVDRQLRVTGIALNLLKSIHDIHSAGFLHRDIKPDNIGLFSKAQPVALLFDFGTAAIYTDKDGECRFPRSQVTFRGTAEYSSHNATMGREFTRYDDLIGWMYTVLEFYNPLADGTPEEKMQLPWTGLNNPTMIAYRKSPEYPASELLKNAPPEFYRIRLHLYLHNRNKAPNYQLIKTLLETAYDRYKAQREEEERQAS